MYRGGCGTLECVGRFDYAELVWVTVSLVVTTLVVVSTLVMLVSMLVDVSETVVLMLVEVLTSVEVLVGVLALVVLLTGAVVVGATIGPVGVIVALEAAAALAEDALYARYEHHRRLHRRTKRSTHAELAAAGSLRTFSRTWSMTWMTPLGRSTSGCVTRAVTVPEITYVPVSLRTNANGSPAADTKVPFASVDEYALVPLMSCASRHQSARAQGLLKGMGTYVVLDQRD